MGVKGGAYTPAQGDLVWLDFSPQSGHEQAGRRPALVISPRAYNDKVGLALFCPVTSQEKGYPFEVAIPAPCPVKGVVLSDQLKSLDWRARHAEFAAHLPAASLREALGKIAALTKYSND
jgi:mRNA interferase MazF